MTFLLSQLDPAGTGLSDLIKLGPAFAVLIFFIGYLIKKVDKLEALLSVKDKENSEMTKDVINGLNKASFALENNPMSTKENVRTVIREEVSSLTNQLKTPSIKP